MIEGLRPYRTYRDAGVPWFEEVPAHWRVMPALAVFRPKRVSNKGMVEDTVLSLSYGRIVEKPSESLHGLVPESFETYQIVDSGNIIVRTTDLQNDKKSLRVGYANRRGIITSAYMCLETRGEVSSEFGYQILNAHDLLKILYAYGSGLRQNLDFDDIKRMPVLCPPAPEQAAIIRFLNYADRRIGRFIRTKQRLINLLEEQRRAIIHRAVTRGLAAAVRLKPSGVEWLGDVPEHWDVRKLRQCGVIAGGQTPSMEVRRFWDGAVPWVTPKDMKRVTISDSSVRVSDAALHETSLRLIDPPAILMVVRGMILARKVPIAWTTAPVTINQDMKALIPAKGINAEFLAQLLASAQMAFAPLIDEAGHGTRRLPTERWAEVAVALPSEDEQFRIVQFLNRATQDSNFVIDRAVHEIGLLSEYRTRLIADVVTGKLDVREAASRLPDDAEESAPLEEVNALVDAGEETADDLDAIPEEATA